ncbi:MAG: tetratricopeptide repeat protein [Rikenellaceae bacterium]
MQKRYCKVILLAMLATVSLDNLQAKVVSSHMKRAEELYEFGRWSDARLELRKAKGEISKLDAFDKQRVDFLLALCAVELEDQYALRHLDYFEELYPASKYSNQVVFNRGLLYCTSEEYELAREELLGVDYLMLSTAERESYDIRMGYIYFRERDYTTARSYLEGISEGSDLYDHALYYKSYIDYAQGLLDSAKEGFTTLSKGDTYGAIAPFYLLQIEFQLGNYDYVISHGVELMKNATTSQQPQIARTVAEAYFRGDDYDGAMKYIATYQASGETMSRADNYILGFSLYRTTHYKDASLYLKSASGADDELTQNASYHLADCYLRLGNKSGAMQAFAMASSGDYNPNIAEDALFNYGKLQYELGGGSFNETINVLTRYINTYPKSARIPEVKKLLVAAYYNSSNYDAAYKAIKEVQNPDAEIKSALQKITYFNALEAMSMDDNASAMKLFVESEKVGISPKYTALSKFWQGEINYYNGDTKGALRDFNTFLSRAPKSDPTYVMAHYSTAYALMGDQNEESALKYFKEYIQMSPKAGVLVTDSYNRIGDILYGKRQFSEAANNYQRASRSGDDGVYYAAYQLSMIAGIQGNYSNKIAKLKSIVATNRGDYVDDAEYELGRTYMTQELYHDAVVTLEGFIANHPNSPKYAQALSDLGLSYLNLGDKEKSINCYDRAIKAAPQSAISKDALQGIREIYVDQGDANGYFAYASKMGMESDLGAVAKDSLSFASAQRLYLSGENINRATKSLSSYVSDYPQGYYLSDALFMLSDCHLKNGDDSRAVETLTQLSQRGDSQYTQRVLERLSKLTYDMGRYADAASAYRKLYDVAKSNAEKASAMDGYASSVIATKDNSQIMTMANDILSQSKSGSKATIKAKYAKATILRERGEWSEASGLYKDLSSTPNTAVGAESTYWLISKAHRDGNVDGAEDMIFKFSESQTTQAYWLAKSFIVLGDIYVSKGDNFQARATYQSIVDGYAVDGDGVKDEAKSKIENLK